MDWCNCVCKFFVLIAATALASSACAQDGPYDPSFGDGGKTWIDVTPSLSDVGQRLITLPNGNLFMVGGCPHACAAWLTPLGALATGFGTSGTGTAAFPDFPGWPNDEYYGGSDAAAFADGRIAVPTRKEGGGYLTVLRADGTGLDPAVGNGAGYVSPPFKPLYVRVTTQQQLIIVGETLDAPAALVVARYDSTLHLDTAFGSGGYRIVGFAEGNASPGGMTLQRDGRIAVIGTILGSTHSIFIVRLTAGGTPDPNFGVNSDGKFQSNFGNSYGANGNAIVEDKKGRLVIAGLAVTSASGQSAEWLVNRLLGGGATDTSFNGGQPQQFTIVSSSTGNGPQACCVALQSDNRIVVAGTMVRPGGTGYYFALSRFFDNGGFDPSFGGGGQSYGDMSSQAPNVLSDYPSSLVMVPGGMVVAGSTSVTSNESRFSATRVRIDLLFAADFE